jgi:YVTN family beta-propeller protein
MRRLILIFSFIILLSGCRRGDRVNQIERIPATRGVYILNEGNFGRGNSSLSFYVPDSNRVYQNVFKNINGRDLGDTGNDIVISDGRVYIVVNNSDKIEVIEAGTHRSVGTIYVPNASPYKIAIAGNRAYVTNLWRGAVTVIDIDGMRVLIDTIKVGSNPQGILVYGNKIYVCNSGFGADRTVSVIDVETNRVIRSIKLFDGPVAIDIDESKLWVLCSGNYGDFNDPTDDTYGKLYAIDPGTNTVVDSIDIGGHPTRLVVYNGFAYVLKDGDVVRVNLKTGEIDGAFIQGNFYSIGIDPVNKLIYCADAKDYVQNGEVSIYDLDGNFLRKFDVGIIPGSFGFIVE